MYLLSFPRFWTLSIERFWFLFWSILNSVTLKTSNYMPLGLPSNTTTRNGKMPHELLRPRFETKVGNFIYRRNKRTKKRQEITLQQLYSGYVKFSWGIYRKGPWKKCVFKRTEAGKIERIYEKCWIFCNQKTAKVRKPRLIRVGAGNVWCERWELWSPLPPLPLPPTLFSS